MGVHGLWDLLAPVGRRVSVETLSGKRLAIDASIWMVQFMKAMRDDKGEMVRNAHLLGFFRRICKLLFLCTKPVFVFDGGTPALKRRTVIVRRRQRENAQAKIRKTAEKLFLNQIKTMRLSSLAENIKDQRGNSKGKEVMVEKSATLEENDATKAVKNQEILDEMLAASIAAEECDGFGSTLPTPAAPLGEASAFTSTSTSTAVFAVEDEDSDDEEIIMPITVGNVDPAVLAALPPSMQLDLLVQMRERLMAENRQKYQKVKKAPQKFSELQIEAYLKTVAFRREIDEVQRAAAGRGVGGVQTSRIASEANREFIFSSSFSGDRQVLASNGIEKFTEKQQLEQKESSSAIADVITASGAKADAEVGPADSEVETYLGEKGRKRIHRNRAMGIRMTRDLQRNIDLMKESEHEMTRATNKIIEQTDGSEVGPSGNFVCGGQFIDATEKLSSNRNSPQKSMSEVEANTDASKAENSINISFRDDGKSTSLDVDDAFFTRLVAGSSLSMQSDDNSTSDIEWEDDTSVKQSNSVIDGNRLEVTSHTDDSDKNESDVEWEEVPIIANEKLEASTIHVDNLRDNEIRVEWHGANTNKCGEVQHIMADVPKAVSKGFVEEESALQEAIRRSLEDITGEKASSVSHDLEKPDDGSKTGEAFIGIERHRLFAGDPSIVLADKDAYSPSTCDRPSESAVGDADRNVLSIFEGNKRILDFKQLNPSAENAQISNMAIDGSGVPTVTALDALSYSQSVPHIDDIANEEVATGTSDMPTGYGSPAAELQTSRVNIQRQDPAVDIGSVSVPERAHDIQFNASYDDDNERFVGSVEDELLVLGKEFRDLENEQKKHERNSDSVNSEMFVECQELLQMFGLPYIIAPMEAEAQCAFLELANLVDGVVTDDSDVFLFGARSVFKNIFDDRKYVETYLLKDIESELGLNTEKLIRMALLLGSDYTEGVSGIGIVNAIEVVNAFPEDDGLHKFREWVESPDPTILGKAGLQSGSSVKNNGSKETSIGDCNTSEENDDNEATDRRRRKQLFMNKHRNVSKNWHLPASFPSDAVISAYKRPQVDKSAEPFSWGKPDIFSLRRLCSEKFAWANQKADELLLPVLKEYNKHETQLRLEAFYSFNEKFANIRSKRIRQAVKGITGKQSLADTEDLRALPKQVKKRGENKSDESKAEKKDDIGERKNSSKRSKAKKRNMKVGENAGETVVDVTGCSRARGSGSGKAGRKCKRIESSDSELYEASLFNLNGNSDEHEHFQQSAPLPQSIRKSKRSCRPTNYVEIDDEIDESTKSPTRTGQKSRNAENGQQKSNECEDAHKVDMTNSSRHHEATSDGDGLFGDYLVKGGGFCADEDNAELRSNRAGPTQSEGCAVDEVSDATYLQMGSGFCTDDGSAAMITPDDAQGVMNVNPSEDHNSTYVGPSKVVQTVGDNDTLPGTISAFSALPFLKRKKRKI